MNWGRHGVELCTKIISSHYMRAIEELLVNGIGPALDVRVTAGILRDDPHFEFEGCGAAATGSTTFCF